MATEFRRYSAVLVFAVAFVLLWLRLGHWFYLSIDEGIYLEGARRVARGEVPYRDFFVITGPGSFWIYGAVFRFFGVSLANARFVLCAELALFCGLICWIVDRFASWLFGVAASLLFLATLLTTQYPLYITHRWDSNAFALLAVALVYRRWFVTAGVCAGVAAWITPPMLIVVIVLAFGVTFWQYAAGVVVTSIIATAVLVSQGAFGSMVRALVWDASNYSGANRLGYPLAVSWPTVLPLVAALGFVVARSRSKRDLTILAAASLAAFLACYPRFGAAQLLFGSAFFWALCASAIACLFPARTHAWVAAGVCLMAGAVAFTSWPRTDLRSIETPVGILKVSKRHYVMLNDLLATIHPGDSVFVYPYLPALYFALGADNPTRYSWLQPGMMGSRDIQSALGDLNARPPHWIVWHDFTEAFILKNWPSSDRTRLRFPEMESFFATNYHAVEPDGVVPIGYRLLEKNQ